MSQEKPKHFDYEAVVMWERELRSRGIHANITRRFRGANVVLVDIQITVQPGDPLPMFEAQKP